MSKSTINVGDKELDFEVGVDDFNTYLNDQMPNDKVAPAYHFLLNTVTEDSKDDFKAVVIVDGKPNGLVALQMAGVLAEQFGGGVQISLKKPKA